MKRKLLLPLSSAYFWFLLLAGSAYAQTIGIPTVNTSAGPVSITFTVTNGLGTPTYFNGASNFTVYLSDASGLNFTAVHTFNSSVFPASENLASATITRTVPMPAGTLSGSNYRIAVGSSMPSSPGVIGANASLPFALNCGFVMPAQLNGFIKCSSPSITYYVLTITNTGNLTDSYSLTKVQSLYPLGSSFLSLSGAGISSTPSLDPGESYTFMMLFETPNGTPPDNWNTHIITGTSAVCGTQVETNISTYIYCGNNHPNLPNAPDMEIVKTASTSSAMVGDFIDYTITIKNTSTRTAHTPVIKDFIPANAELISYNKAPGETRNVTFNHNQGNNTLTALIQGHMTVASAPLSINIRVKTNCSSVPFVTNSAEVSSVSGDHNSDNDVSSVTTAVNYNLATATVGRWTGSFSNDWFDCRNWSGGVVPNNNVDVLIPSQTPFSEISALSPLAPADKIARTHHIDIAGSVSMTDAGLLHIAGNWNSNNNFSRGDGSVTFMGSQANQYQFIADATQRVDFYTLNIQASNSAKGLSVPTNFGLFVHNDLNLVNGNMRLNGKSQLIQTKPGASNNLLSGNGKVLVDQQGQSNIYSYNYWSSPVGTGNYYSVGSVLNDGSNPENPQPVNWISGYNGAPTSPICLSPFWLNKYQNGSGAYAAWSCIGQTGILAAGQGYTMKGSGATTPQQNYTFSGKPNNGTFTSSVSANNMNLCGNPYPSALDAYQFIDDNASTITGTLYFWEQFSTNSSHITANYEGGYATLTKTGATPPAAPVGVSSAGSSSRVPGRYIPIAQGFLLFGSASGGPINFSNTQRAFVRESDSLSNPMFRNSSTARHHERKVRIGMAAGGMKRQVLLGYMNSNATSGYDHGYDAYQIDTGVNDVYFPLGEEKLVIQARGPFDPSDSVPLTVKLKRAGNVMFYLDGAENFSSDEVIYIFDSITGIHHPVSNNVASIALSEGTHSGRFFIRFGDVLAKISEPANPSVLAANGQATIFGIKNLKNAALFDIAGRFVKTVELDQSNSFSTSGLQSGVYIIRAGSESVEFSQKVIIP